MNCFEDENDYCPIEYNSYDLYDLRCLALTYLIDFEDLEINAY